MIGRLDRQLAYLDYRIVAAYGTVETVYAPDLHESHKDDAFRCLEDLIEERDDLRRAWASPVRLEPARPRRRALFGPSAQEIPVYDQETLIL